MLKEAIAKAETILLAQEAACRELGVDLDEVEFEILQMPSKKKLGLFGGKPAEVKAILKKNPAKAAKEYLSNIFEKMEVGKVNIDIEETDEGVTFNLTGDDVGAVIGRRGETLDALQYLSGLVANNINDSYFRLTINTGNYREKREDTLTSLGKRLAIKAIKTGRVSSLEPMNPYERRIVHTAVQNVQGACSWSEGEGVSRHVVIGLDPKQKQNRSNNRSYNKDRYNKTPYNNSRNNYLGEPTKTIIKEEPKEDSNSTSTPLYSRIETKN